MLTLVLLCLAPRKAVGQDLVQAAVDGLSDPQQARTASEAVLALPGVLMARFDVPTRNMMLHATEQAVLDKATLNAALAGTGVQVRCVSRRPVRLGPFRHVDSGRCPEQPFIDR
ncbi:MAG: hypothetical protein QY325_15100 [Flavobacteriales bacterium]|nr:MAG: hypothetical protein QY325_15100 [Flavobacteriales bacterium]